MTEDESKAGPGGEKKSVLGLVDEAGAPIGHADWREWARAAPGTVFAQPEPEQLIDLTVIVPARNEEQSIGECLRFAGCPERGDFRAGPGLGTDRG